MALLSITAPYSLTARTVDSPLSTGPSCLFTYARTLPSQRVITGAPATLSSNPVEVVPTPAEGDNLAVAFSIFNRDTAAAIIVIELFDGSSYLEIDRYYLLPGDKATDKGVFDSYGSLRSGNTGPANVLTIGTVETLPAGTPATAEIVGVAPAQVLNLGIPEGASGGGGGGGGVTEVGGPGFTYRFEAAVNVVGIQGASLRWNAQLPNSVTEIYLHEFDLNNLIAPFLDLLDPGVIICIYNPYSDSETHQFLLSSITDNGSYRTLAVSLIASGSLFANNSSVKVLFYAPSSGNAGGGGVPDVVLTLSTKTENYTASPSDFDGKTKIYMNLPVPNTFTLPDGISAGRFLIIRQAGSGKTAIAATSGTLTSESGYTAIAAQYGEVIAVSTGSNNFDLSGRLGA